MFRAFLHLSQEECDTMPMEVYLNYCLVLEDALRLLHAPFMPHE